MYCIKEQGIPFDSKRYTPCLLLENSRDDALKFQQMVVRFNELYPGNKRIVYDACETFTIPDSIFAYTIYSGFIKDPYDPRSEDVGCFYYDTPLERYEAFLREEVEKQSRTVAILGRGSFKRNG